MLHINRRSKVKCRFCGRKIDPPIPFLNGLPCHPMCARRLGKEATVPAVIEPERDELREIQSRERDARDLYDMGMGR